MSQPQEWEPFLIMLEDLRPAWQAEAACRGISVEPRPPAADEAIRNYQELKGLFFPVAEGPASHEQIDRAKELKNFAANAWFDKSVWIIGWSRAKSLVFGEA
jgi:hypothetical protein